MVLFLVVFNGINYYEISMNIYLLSWKSVGNKESKSYEDF